jgi:hypothetical protein
MSGFARLFHYFEHMSHASTAAQNRVIATFVGGTTVLATVTYMTIAKDSELHGGGELLNIFWAVFSAASFAALCASTFELLKSMLVLGICAAEAGMTDAQEATNSTELGPPMLSPFQRLVLSSSRANPRAPLDSLPMLFLYFAVP